LACRSERSGREGEGSGGGIVLAATLRFDPGAMAAAVAAAMDEE